MKKKVVLVLLLLVLAFTTVAPLREFAAPVVDPAGDAVHAVAGPILYELRDRLYTWMTRNEMRRFARQLNEAALARQPLPNPNNFTNYILRTNVTASAADRWGTPYFLLLQRDSVIVGSAGPDLEPGTADDLHEGFVRPTR